MNYEVLSDSICKIMVCDFKLNGGFQRYCVLVVGTRGIYLEGIRYLELIQIMMSIYSQRLLALEHL